MELTLEEIAEWADDQRDTSEIQIIRHLITLLIKSQEKVGAYEKLTAIYAAAESRYFAKTLTVEDSVIERILLRKIKSLSE